MELVLSRDIPKLMEQFPHEGHYKKGVDEQVARSLPPPPTAGAAQLTGPSGTGDLYEHVPAPAYGQVQDRTEPKPALMPPAPPAPADAASSSAPSAGTTARALGAMAITSAASVAASRITGGSANGEENPFGSSGAGATSQTDWAITPAERAQYHEIFATLSPSGGKVGGAAVRPVLERSGLPIDTLRTVWELADVDKDGQLDEEEFALAMHLVRKQVSGEHLPERLPANLVPPSKRGASAVPPTARPAGVAELE